MDNTLFWQLLVDLLILLGTALVLGVVCERLRQSAVVGYMLAGVLVGPHGFGAIGNSQSVSIIAQLGVALLMFTIGLEFSWSKLKRLGLVALGSGTTQIVATGAIAAAVAMMLGVPTNVAVIIGAVMALSSTAVVAPVLAKRAELDSVHGRFALGVLLVQDAAVVPLVLLVGALVGGGTVSQTLIGTAQSVGYIIGFIVVSWLVSRYVLPIALRGTLGRGGGSGGGGAGNREVPILLAFVAAVGASAAAKALGLSAALGAFIAAIFLGESVVATQVRADIASLKTLFVTMFFGSIGMYAEPAWVMAHLPMVLGVLIALVIGKAVVVVPIALAFRLPPRHAVAAGLSLAQIGVFSFVLMRVATTMAPPDAEAISGPLYKLLVAVIILSIFITPYVAGSATLAGGWTELLLRRWGVIRTKPGEALADPVHGDRGHVVLIGFGPAGRAVAEALRDQDTPIALADLNMRTVLQARAAGMRAVVGDATQPETLDHLNLGAAAALVVTLPDHRLSEQVIRQARAMNPTLRIIARSRYSAYVRDLSAAGAGVVIDEETTLGKRVGEALSDALYTGDVEKSETSGVLVVDAADPDAAER